MNLKIFCHGRLYINIVQTWRDQMPTSTSIIFHTKTDRIKYSGNKERPVIGNVKKVYIIHSLIAEKLVVPQYNAP